VTQNTEADQDLIINQRMRIPRAELHYRFARASGPGGQNVNKTETAVELLFDLAHSPSLTNEERAMAMQRLASHLDLDGVLRLEARSERSQLRNRMEVTERFARTLREALQPVKHRRATRPSRASQEARLEHKRRAGSIKRTRQRPRLED
jgi:ribosome-associated protein